MDPIEATPRSAMTPLPADPGDGRAVRRVAEVGGGAARLSDAERADASCGGYLVLLGDAAEAAPRAHGVRRFSAPQPPAPLRNVADVGVDAAAAGVPAAAAPRGPPPG